MIVFKGWQILDTEERGEFRSVDVKFALNPDDGRYGVLFRIFSPIINEIDYSSIPIFLYIISLLH